MCCENIQIGVPYATDPENPYERNFHDRINNIMHHWTETHKGNRRIYAFSHNIETGENSIEDITDDVLRDEAGRSYTDGGFALHSDATATTDKA